MSVPASVPVSVLEKIARSVRARLEGRRSKLPLEELKTSLPSYRKPRPFLAALTPKKSPVIIAEIKFSSPSEGVLAANHDPVSLARDYLSSGASALSILTEQDYFAGHPDYLRKVRAANPETPLLMKDFVVDEYQLFEALSLGADCILLIVALLGAERTGSLLRLSQSLGLSALVEVHNEKEMETAVSAGSRLIGVNNRDLKSLKTSLDVSRKLAPMKPRGSLLVCESGIQSGEQIREMTALGFDAFLVGTSLMRTGDAGVALARLIRESSPTEAYK